VIVAKRMWAYVHWVFMTVRPTEVPAVGDIQHLVE